MSMSMASVDQFLNFGLSLVSMRIFQKSQLQSEKAIFTLRVVYVVSNVIQLLFFVYIMQKIKKTNDSRMVKIRKEVSLFQEENDVEEEEMTYGQYDMLELNKMKKSTMIQFLVVCALHLKFKAVQPLFVQSFTPIRSLFLNPLYMAHVWNRNVLRPFDLNMLFKKAESAKEVKEKGEEQKSKRIKED
ncbi:phosphate transport (Pho88) protein [Ordospora pajunii]|uniref:phosphate transport (Pho88) protein n=1 Tax=Ordospora pajunii TaxID=3039483 RepID=UPI0029527C99|nr:phosphate transport (Pho88) protein [Ordospora pajunii]KAH9410695.1 phosphate transport (Pho88) protein [Ordospora pajunii]